VKLDRNINETGQGKYALIKMRDLALFEPHSLNDPSPIGDALELLHKNGLIDYGEQHTEREFFVIRLRDKYAADALFAYAKAARADDGEYADEICEMALRAGDDSPFCKKPD
jgi:hypothetical protein